MEPAAGLLVRELGLGAASGIIVPRELMLLARALVNLEATARVVDPELDLTRLVRRLQPELRATLLPGPSSL